jgi:DNA-directed RNA polymerase subunit M/transcription elongation factor TFIIS
MSSRYYECPNCSAEVELASYEKMKFCPECGKLLELDADVDNYGMENQRDLSKLIERKPE